MGIDAPEPQPGHQLAIDPLQKQGQWRIGVDRLWGGHGALLVMGPRVLWISERCH
jgi:hypothetical protein